VTPGPKRRATVVGGGPAGLMAAQDLAAAGVQVDVYDAMPSVGRKFLLAGKGGLNLTHSEAMPAFVSRYAERADRIAPMLDGLGPQALRDWAATLGIQTFVGSSGRVFPKDMKAAPLLRAWLHRLREAGVDFHMRHRWLGWADDGALRFSTPQGEIAVRADATVLALGGASWARLGSDGAWVPLLRARGVDIAPLAPSNCGFDVAPTAPGRAGWSEHLRKREAGQPLKSVRLRFTDAHGARFDQQGECVVTETGLEGSLVYAASARLREAIAAQGHVDIELDLLPARDAAWVAAEVAHPRGPRSMATHLHARLHVQGVKAALLWETLEPAQRSDTALIASRLKALPLRLAAPRPIDEAISTAGGVRFEALDESLMCRTLPGVFCAGEMLDWEAPTGGYLLTACFASGRVAGGGAARWLGQA